MDSKRKLFLFLLGLAYLVIGFFREFLFVNINMRIWELREHVAVSRISPSLHFLTSYSDWTLYYSKWPLTFLFTAMFAAIACGISWILFREKRYIRWTLLAYGIVFTGGFVIAGLGMLSGHFDKLYIMARFLADVVEKPVMIILLIPAFYLHRAGQNR